MKLAPKLLFPILMIAGAIPAFIFISLGMQRNVTAANAEAMRTQDQALSASEIRSLSRAVQRDTFKIIISPLAPAAAEARAQIQQAAPVMIARSNELAQSLSWIDGDRPRQLLPLIQELVEAATAADEAATDVGRDVAMQIFRSRVEPAATKSSALVDQIFNEISKRITNLRPRRTSLKRRA